MIFVAFIALLALLILSHEAGHFFASKIQKIKVEEFGFGFPPRLFSFKKGETLYSLNFLPLGGFVKVFGEDGGDPSDQKSFASRRFWEKFFVLVAGVTMNIVLAFLLFSFGYWQGIPAVGNGAHLQEVKVVVEDISPLSPASRSGILPGDIITGISREGAVQTVLHADDFKKFIDASKGEQVIISLMREGKTLTIKVSPRLNPPAGEGALGVAFQEIGVERFPWYQAVWEGLKATVFTMALTVKVFFLLITNIFRGDFTLAKQVSGPIGIYFFVGQSVRLGIAYFIYIAALLSVNLAVLNALPIPALDGGRILFLIIEKIRGKTMNSQTERMVHTIGMALLFLLVVLVSYNDIVRHW